MTLEVGMITIRLKQLLEEKGMSQAELAKITGIRSMMISDLCNGKCTSIKFEQINRICNALLCDIGDLLKLSDR